NASPAGGDQLEACPGGCRQAAGRLVIQRGAKFPKTGHEGTELVTNFAGTLAHAGEVFEQPLEAFGLGLGGGRIPNAGQVFLPLIEVSLAARDDRFGPRPGADGSHLKTSKSLVQRRQLQWSVRRPNCAAGK